MDVTCPPSVSALMPRTASAVLQPFPVRAAPDTHQARSASSVDRYRPLVARGRRSHVVDNGRFPNTCRRFLFVHDAAEAVPRRCGLAVANVASWKAVPCRCVNYLGVDPNVIGRNADNELSWSKYNAAGLGGVGTALTVDLGGRPTSSIADGFPTLPLARQLGASYSCAARTICRIQPPS